MVRMKRILSEIKALGVKVALDDFGTGYSSLNHIREMPLDIIKIDKCFIEHLGEDDFSDAFVKMVTERQHNGVHVCVELRTLTGNMLLLRRWEYITYKGISSISQCA